MNTKTNSYRRWQNDFSSIKHKIMCSFHKEATLLVELEKNRTVRRNGIFSFDAKLEKLVDECEHRESRYFQQLVPSRRT